MTYLSDLPIFGKLAYSYFKSYLRRAYVLENDLWLGFLFRMISRAAFNDAVLLSYETPS